MPPELVAALVAAAVAGLTYLRIELELRAARRHREAIELRVDDVQHKVGADRRDSDFSGESGDMRQT